MTMEQDFIPGLYIAIDGLQSASPDCTCKA